MGMSGVKLPFEWLAKGLHDLHGCVCVFLWDLHCIFRECVPVSDMESYSHGGRGVSQHASSVMASQPGAPRSTPRLYGCGISVAKNKVVHLSIKLSVKFNSGFSGFYVLQILWCNLTPVSSQKHVFKSKHNTFLFELHQYSVRLQYWSSYCSIFSE